MSGSIRQQKFSKLVLKELSDIFQQDKRGFLGNAFITISDVLVSPDLGIARVYVSMMLVQDKQAVLEKINAHKSEIRKALGDKIRKQVRVIPDLVFFIDELQEQATKMDALIESLKIPSESTKKGK
jgi:ribosome-binding factor A